MKRKVTIFLVLVLLVALFAGCTDNNEDTVSQNNTATYTSASSSETSLQVDNVDIQAEYSESEIQASYDESDATAIYLNDDETTIQGSGATFKDNTVNILNAGTYVLSGSLDGQIVVNATNVDEVQIVLNNANITNSQGAAIYIRQAEKVILTLEEGSVNTVSDGSNYSDNGDDAPNATIFSDDDLVINGNGTLTVQGNYKHGIKCSDDLSIISGNINVTAVNDGIRGKDSVAILDGSIVVSAGGDGITATNSEDIEKGWISVDGGVFSIDAANNGFQAESALIINAGEINVTAGQDTYHSNYDIVIAGGTSILESGDDGMHADNNLQITNGYVDVVSDYEGLEGANVYISGGNIAVETVDDGINAAGGSDLDTAADDNFKSQSGNNVLVISGGDVYVSCIGDEADGLDSNGDIYLSGGTVVIDGAVSQRDAAIDINNGTLEYSGGTLTSVGSDAMLVIPTTVNQPLITIIFGSSQQAGETIEVSDSDGNTVLSFTPEKTYTVAMLSDPALTVGETYTVSLGGSEQFDITLNTTSVTVDGDGNEAEYSGMTGPGGTHGSKTGKGGR